MGKGFIRNTLEEIAYQGVKRRAQKKGVIVSDRDLTNKETLSKVIKSEHKRMNTGTGSKLYWNGLLAYYSICSGVEEAMLGFKRELDHMNYIPAKEAYDEQVMQYNPGTEIYEVKTVHHNAEPSRYDPVWNWMCDHPEFIIPAIAVPAVAIGVLYADYKWNNFCEEYITKKNIKKKALEKMGCKEDC